MKWLDAMKNAIDYLENHLEEQIDMDAVAQAAYSSKFHFQRMFHMLTGVTVAEYVRRRRLTLAAQDLASTKAMVMNIAFKYGYESPESFAKAFQKMHGITPSAARQPGVSLKSYPPMSFHISIKGDKNMNYKMVEREGFEIIGKTVRVTSTKPGQNDGGVTKFWSQSNENGFTRELADMTDSNVIYGICLDFEMDENDFTYMIAIQKPETTVPSDLEVRQIPASLWAVFEAVGPLPQSIQNVWERIFSEWFPASSYEHSGGPELEVYPIVSEGEQRCEVWIPVIKK